MGDTGYTDLKTPAVPMPYRTKDFKILDSINISVRSRLDLLCTAS